MNIAFHSVPCIHSEWAIFGDDDRDASRKLLYLYQNTVRQDLTIPIIGLCYVQMWKWIIMISLCDTFSGPRAMLKSLRNHRQSQQPTRMNDGLLIADSEKEIVFHGHCVDCNWVCTSKQVGLEVNTIIGYVMGWRNSKSTKLSSSDAPTLNSQIGWPVPRECNTDTRMRDPNCGRYL